MKYLYATVLLSTICLITSCRKDQETNTETDVFVAGYHNMFASYWVNGVERILTNGNTSAVAYAIIVNGNDVYVAGHDGDTAKVWKNGVARNLTDGKMESRVNSIAILNNDVFVAGYERDSIT